MPHAFVVPGGGAVMSGPWGYGPGGGRLWSGGGWVGSWGGGSGTTPPMNKQTRINTRMHSSRMHTTCSLTVSHSIRLGGGMSAQPLGCRSDPADADPHWKQSPPPPRCRTPTPPLDADPPLPLDADPPRYRPP